MALFPWTAGVVGQAHPGLFEQLFQQAAPVLQQGLAQSQFDGLQVARPLPCKILPDQPQERFGFPELLGLDFRDLEFFLASGSPSANWVIWSVKLMHWSAKA